ncbi:MAG: SpoIIE family protein phosphatase [Planctomycetes bacterium]|nr:SpoIIE family protein phosphatase [Planctomycetota bacterium]
MNALPALAGALPSLHAALTAGDFVAALLFDAGGHELARAGRLDAPVSWSPRSATLDGLPIGLVARARRLGTWGTTLGWCVLVGPAGVERSAAQAAADAAFALCERVAGLDFEIEDLARELAETYEAIHLLCDATAASARAASAADLALALLEQLGANVRCGGAALLLAEGARPGPAAVLRLVARQGRFESLAPNALLPVRPLVAGWLAAPSPVILDDVAELQLRHRDEPLLAVARGTLLAVPLRSRHEPVGLLLLVDREERPQFSARDGKLADAVATHAGAMLLGLRIAELSKELALGRRIQQSLLPSALPQLGGLELAGHCAMARAMGGDFYDALPGPAGELRAVIADVSGHDLGAALFMAAARAQFRTELLGRRRPGPLATRMNALLHGDLARAGLFVTYFALTLDVRRGVLRYAAGGHNPPLLLRRGAAAPEPLAATGLPAGVAADARAGERRRKVAPGDLLLLYTDGLTEAESPQGEPFGEERLGELLVRHRERPAAELVARLQEAIADFRGGAAATDDGTALLIKVLPPIGPKRAE